MNGVDKVKIALDECRMLALGVQVLIGFQCQGVFQPRFHDVPITSKVGQIVGLVLLITSLGALIVPSMQHVLVERLNATRRIEAILTRSLDLSLLPLAAAFSLDIAIARRTTLSDRWAAAFGGVTFITALAFWFGWSMHARVRKGSRERKMAARRTSEQTPLSKRIDQMLTEARTVLPGAQALLGFQLMVFFVESFATLPWTLKVAHGAALLSVAITVLLLMTPAVYHRIVYAGEDSIDVLRVGCLTVTASTLSLAAALGLDAFVVCAHALDAPIAAVGVGISVCGGLIAAWWIYPALARHARN